MVTVFNRMFVFLDDNGLVLCGIWILLKLRFVFG